MKNTKSLSSLRIGEKTFDNIDMAIEKYNENNLMPMSKNEFRRLANELLAQLILQDKEVPIKLQM